MCLEWIPLLCTWAVIVLSYFAYVVQFCVFGIEDTAEKITYLVLYHILFLMLIWSYLATIFTSPASVPYDWAISRADMQKILSADLGQRKKILDNISRGLPIQMCDANGLVRFCEECEVIKPDRAHHCSVCERCVLKMDHHCPWVNNCVNYSNQKFFVLFMCYAMLYCLFVASTVLKPFMLIWQSESFQEDILSFLKEHGHIIILFLSSLIFAALVAVLLVFHIYLVFSNSTTLEYMRAPIFRVGGENEDGFNIGICNNFEEVFGSNCLLWFFPIFSTIGDGLWFPTGSELEQEV